ncbi:MAG TPA: ABC transporter permease, partial [Bacteroidales bacterium]|nr:ABC transporter permease [Bacteroidales bacterium]
MFVLAIKDLRLFLKDRKAIFLTFLLPVALITLFALAYGGIIGKSDPQPERLLVCDADSSALSQDLIGRLKEVEGMTLEAVDTFTAGESIRKGQRLALVYVGEGFNDSLNQGGPLPLFLWYDAAKEMEASLLQEVVLSRIAPEITRMQNQQRIRAYLTQRFAVMGPDSIASIGRDLEGYMSGESGGSLVRPVPVSGRQEVNFGLIQAVAGVAVMMLLFSVTAIGGSILGEKESGT